MESGSDAANRGATKSRGLGRREFLGVGAAAVVGLVSAKASSGDSSGSPPPATNEDTEALFVEAFGADGSKEPPNAKQAVEQCPDPFDSRLPAPEEASEIVISWLWCEFARSAALFNIHSIEWPAIVFARDRIRGDVMADVGKLSCPTPGEPGECNLQPFPLASYSQKWRELGSKAGEKASADDSKKPIIKEGDIQAAWEVVYKDHELTPTTPLGFRDEATEVIGSHLWVVYTLGVLAGIDRDFGVDLIKVGRLYSRYYVNKNVVVFGVTNGNDKPKYSKWDWEGMWICAHHTGKVSARKAKLGDSSNIQESHFHEAWCITKEVVKKAMGSRDYSSKAAGCG